MKRCWNVTLTGQKNRKVVRMVRFELLQFKKISSWDSKAFAVLLTLKLKKNFI